MEAVSAMDEQSHLRAREWREEGVFVSLPSCGVAIPLALGRAYLRRVLERLDTALPLFVVY